MLIAALVLSLVLLGVAGVVIVRLRRTPTKPHRGRADRLLPGGGPVQDLAKDAFTDDQRYLM